jgi:ADP-ribosylglycohydrolase
MFSDDTEHACMTAQALLVSAGEPDHFLRSLSWKLRFWLLGFTLAAGKATLKACIKLWLGWSAKHSGCWSAGNGPAMRAPILGVCFGDRPDLLRRLVRAATRITHIDPKAEWGALVVANAAHLAARFAGAPLPVDATIGTILENLPPESHELKELIARVQKSIASGQSTEAFAAELGLQKGVTGYMFHTVPMVLHAWLSAPDDYRASVESIIRCGGDTDTTAAIVGALAGARLGKDSIPNLWRRKLAEWPRNERWIDRLAKRLARMLEEGKPQRAVAASWLGIVSRNLLFDLVVLAHVVRRLLPPY